jgi:hypothetical protein
MHPLNGMTSSQKFVNISDVIPALTWTETRPYQCVLRICIAKTTLFRWKMGQYTRKLNNVGGNLPRDCRSDNRLFLFQSCYGVGCPGAVT